jgi:hypothetical protein
MDRGRDRDKEVKKKGNFQVRSMTEENKDDSSMSIYLYI